MQDARETGRREPEMNEEEEEEEEGQLVGMEPEVDSEMGTEVTAEREPARLTAHDESGVVPLPEVNETGAFNRNATDAVFTKVLEKKKALIQKGIDVDKAKVKEFVKATVNEVESKAYDNPHLPPVSYYSVLLQCV